MKSSSSSKARALGARPRLDAIALDCWPNQPMHQSIIRSSDRDPLNLFSNNNSTTPTSHKHSQGSRAALGCWRPLAPDTTTLLHELEAASSHHEPLSLAPQQQRFQQQQSPQPPTGPALPIDHDRHHQRQQHHAAETLGRPRPRPPPPAQRQRRPLR